MWEQSKTHPGRAKALLASCVYNEACSSALIGKKEDALKQLGLSFEMGFDDLDHAKQDSDFGDLLETDEFKKVIADAEQAAAERKAAEVKKQIAEFESYDFDFELEDVKGEKIKKEDFKGKTLIVDIWGTWCPPCRREIPSFVKLKKQYKGKLEIVGLAYERTEDEDEARDDVVDFMEEYDVNYPCALGNDKVKDQVPDFRGYPTTLFIDSKGKVRMEVVGLRPFSELESLMKAVMDAGAEE